MSGSIRRPGSETARGQGAVARVGSQLRRLVDYGAIKSRPLTKEEVIARLKELASDGESLAATAHGKLAAAAHRHFGSWRGAVAQAGETPAGIKWTSAAVIAGIHAHQAKGQPINSVAMMRRDMNLYMAGRRRFGNWAAALAASTTGERAPGRIAVEERTFSRKRAR